MSGGKNFCCWHPWPNRAWILYQKFHSSLLQIQGKWTATEMSITCFVDSSLALLRAHGLAKFPVWRLRVWIQRPMPSTPEKTHSIYGAWNKEKHSLLEIQLSERNHLIKHLSSVYLDMANLILLCLLKIPTVLRMLPCSLLWTPNGYDFKWKHHFHLKHQQTWSANCCVLGKMKDT